MAFQIGLEAEMTESKSNPKAVRSRVTSRKRKWAFRLAALSISLFIAAIAVELFFLVLEKREQSRTISEGSGGRLVFDRRWGFKASQGPFRSVTPEFDTTGEVNNLYMN